MNQAPRTDAPAAAPAPPPAPASLAPRPSILSGFSALTVRAYQFYTLSAILQQMAESMQQLANSWFAYTLTGSTIVLGLALLAQAIPQTVFSFAGGVVADRFN